MYTLDSPSGFSLRLQAAERHVYVLWGLLFTEIVFKKEIKNIHKYTQAELTHHAWTEVSPLFVK